MPASDAQIKANRRNALLSTGPRTARGKERARANAVKHGLAGAGIALPLEDETAVATRFLMIQEDLAPQSMLGAVLAHQMALMSVRLQRAALQESAALATRVRHAASDFDAARADEVDALIAAIEADPARSRRKLLALPEGVERLVEGLLGLHADLARPGAVCDPARERLLDAYCGRRLLGSAASTSSTTAALARIDAEIERLAVHLDGFDFEAIERDRAEAGARALFDPGPEATLARKYEAAASRGLFRALREFREVEAEAAATAPDEAPERIEAPPRGDDRPESAPAGDDSWDDKSFAAQDLSRQLGSFGNSARGARAATDRGAPGDDSARFAARPAAGSAFRVPEPVG